MDTQTKEMVQVNDSPVNTSSQEVVSASLKTAKDCIRRTELHMLHIEDGLKATGIMYDNEKLVGIGYTDIPGVFFLDSINVEQLSNLMVI